MVMGKRITENMDDSPNFEEREGITEKFILDGIHTAYKEYKLDKIERWQQGTMAYSYLNPKDKDPINKSRLVTAYANFPLRCLYKRISRAGTWLLRMLPGTMRHWTLHRITDIPNRVQEAMKGIQRNYSDKTRIIFSQSDVTQMFTNL